MFSGFRARFCVPGLDWGKARVQSLGYIWTRVFGCTIATRGCKVGGAVSGRCVP